MNIYKFNFSDIPNENSGNIKSEDTHDGDPAKDM
jgi:hypothetical protein